MNDRIAPAPNLERLLAALETAAEPAATTWLRDGVERLAALPAQARGNLLGTLSAGAQRRLGREPLGPAVPLATACGPLPVARWRRGDAARACLLLTAAGEAEPGWETLARDLFRQGDEDERTAVVRALCLLPEPCALLALALEAGRTNSMAFYAALALDNPFPAACYDERAFNQVVLKCPFNGLPIERIAGLAERANPDLSRMCEDYVGERTAAGRTVPVDIWLALAPHAGPSGLALTLAHLDHADPAHRRHAALALAARRGAPGIAAALAARLANETDPAVQAALSAGR